MLEDRYEITKLLGKGRTGGVYEAVDTKLGRKVAMRRFFGLNNSSDFSEHIEEFQDVAQSLSGLQHSNLLSVFDAGVDDDGAYIISQLVEGETLHDRIKNKSLPIPEVRDLALQMLDALSVAHKEGFIHGAMTPGSIMMSERERGGYRYVILDMGLPRLAPLIQGKDSMLAVMADPAILAPELFDNSKATERADLYMLGHILYMCLAGGHPFAGHSFAEAEKLHLEGLPPLENFNKEVPEDFILWVRSLIEINPMDRPVSAIEALNTLASLKKPAKKVTVSVNHPKPAELKIVVPNLQVLTVPVVAPVAPVEAVSTSLASDAIEDQPVETIVQSLEVEGFSSERTSEKGPSKKRLLIGVGSAVIVCIAIVAFMLIRDKKERNDVTSQMVEPSDGIGPGKVIIANFDGSKTEHKDWDYESEAFQRLDSKGQGWVMDNTGSKTTTALRFPIRSYADTMYSKGWKLTYVVKPLKGTHRFGFQVRSNIGEGWSGTNHNLYLVIDRSSERLIRLSARDSTNKIKRGKIIRRPYAGDEGWHTITVTQKPGSKTGDYTVSIDGKKAFDDSLTVENSFRGSWNDHLFNSSFQGKRTGQWLIKSFVLESL